MGSALDPEGSFGLQPCDRVPEVQASAASPLIVATPNRAHCDSSPDLTSKPLPGRYGSGPAAGGSSVDDVKKTYREAETNVKKEWRKADGEEDLGDKAANAGDELRKHAGNAGDDIREGVDDVKDAAKDETERRY